MMTPCYTDKEVLSVRVKTNYFTNPASVVLDYVSFRSSRSIVSYFLCLRRVYVLVVRNVLVVRFRLGTGRYPVDRPTGTRTRSFPYVPSGRPDGRSYDTYCYHRT